MIELSLPAGNLENAVYAFTAGADSVYFGLKEFSARKGAENFSLSDFRKIRRYAKERGKKIYITINTLIKDDELEKVFSILEEISKYGVDGIIVQDLGIIRILKKYFPDLPIHASTQLAVHTDYGVKMLKELGAERVVLSRELSLEEIGEIRKKNPDIELKVFIHGAMCYGFSGLCMASLEKTGRSANRGECAQICRTWFSKGGEKLFPFSMKDMEAGEEILKLEEMGIDSVKVEGRMKGNEYVYYTARYYRSILDAVSIEDKHQYTFLREHSDGYFHYKGPFHTNLITENYTGHEGRIVGKITEQKGRKIKAVLEEKINERDGLMIIKGNNEVFRFSARMTENNEFLLPEDLNIPYGTKLYKVSDSSCTLKKINTEAMKEEKELIPSAIIISDGMITISTPLLAKSYKTETEKAQKEGFCDEVFRIFSQSTEEKALDIKEIRDESNLTIRAKELKNIRRDYLKELCEITEKKRAYEAERDTAKSITLPDRSLLTSEDYPWNEEGVEIDGTTYITLSPITYDESGKYERLLEVLSKTRGEVLIGLNNIADVYFAKQHPSFSYFMDIYLYASNRESVALIKDILGPSLKGAYLALEFSSYTEPWVVMPSFTGNYVPPLFISRSCFRHDSLKENCSGCKKSHDYRIRQNGKDYTVKVRNCQTLLTEEPS